MPSAVQPQVYVCDLSRSEKSSNDSVFTAENLFQQQQNMQRKKGEIQEKQYYISNPALSHMNYILFSNSSLNPQPPS